MRKLTEEQMTTMDKLGYKGQHLVAAGFYLAALLIVIINMICRYSDSHKYDAYAYTEGTIVRHSTSKIPRTGSGKIRYDYIYTIEVEYYTDDSDKPFRLSDTGDAYEFFRKGDTLRIYYDEEYPGIAFMTKKDIITGLYVPAEKQYNIPLYLAIFPVIIGTYLLVDYEKAKKLALQNKLKPGRKIKSSVDPDYDSNLHELARMSGYKRGWFPFWIAGISFYLLMTFGGIMTIRSVIIQKPDDLLSPIIWVIFIMILSHGMLAGVIASMVYLNNKKIAFINAFMADEATAVYSDRDEAAHLLWKLVKRYMESEPAFSRFKLAYNRDWLESFEDRLEHLKGTVSSTRPDVQPNTQTNTQSDTQPDVQSDAEPVAQLSLEESIRNLGFSVKTINDGRNKPYIEVLLKKTPDKQMVTGMLNLLTYEKIVRFYDVHYKSGSDPGRYFEVFMTEGKAVYSYANHGWSSNHKCTTVDDMADLIIKNWHNYSWGIPTYENFILIKDNLYAARDRGLYLNALQDVKPISEADKH